MTVVPVNVDALKKQEKTDSKSRWKTEDGWIYPGMRESLEDNKHPKKPHVAAVDELKEVELFVCFVLYYLIMATICQFIVVRTKKKVKINCCENRQIPQSVKINCNENTHRDKIMRFHSCKNKFGYNMQFTEISWP